MSKKWIVTALSLVVIGGAALVFAANTSWLTGSTDEQLSTLAGVQPGLGTVMIEYADRMGNMYYAAKVDNWGMAAYQLKEATEIQEVGETTRPGKAGLLKAFEGSNLTRVGNDIVNQDFKVFESDFGAMVEGCNACHAGTGHDFIVYQLPDQAAVPAKLDTGQTFTKEQLQGILAELLGQ